MRRVIPTILAGALLLTIQCGHQKVSDRKVLATTDVPKDAQQTQQTQTIETQNTDEPAAKLLSMIQADELRAANVLRDALKQNDNRLLAAWSAVYTLRIGIKHDESLSNKALIKGTKSDDQVLATLCWRWLASKSDFRVPKKPKFSKADPVLRVMAAVALASRGRIPKSIGGALGFPDQDLPQDGHDHSDETKSRVEELLTLSIPVDDGPLALAVTFVEAQRKEWTEKDTSGKPSWVAQRLRNELVKITVEEAEPTIELLSKMKRRSSGSFTVIGKKLETSFLGHTRTMLHSIAVTGKPSLRIQALDAMTILVKEPTTADFGAAATALDSEDPFVQITGARTFLMLSMKARRN